jgi:hypothetical protein
MLTIAGGVILGVIGLWLIFALIGTISENIEEIAQGCVLVIGLLVVLGFALWLDSEWPEIDWTKTAFAAVGLLLATILVTGLFLGSPILKKSQTEKSSSKLKKNLSSPEHCPEPANYSDPPAPPDKRDMAATQNTDEPVSEETEEEWTFRVARELRISREGKQSIAPKQNFPDDDVKEILSEYLKWKDKKSDR